MAEPLPLLFIRNSQGNTGCVLPQGSESVPLPISRSVLRQTMKSKSFSSQVASTGFSFPKAVEWQGRDSSSREDPHKIRVLPEWRKGREAVLRRVPWLWRCLGRFSKSVSAVVLNIDP